MSRYRLFTNDRGKRNGIPMYSGFKDVNAATHKAAAAKCPPQFDAPNFAPAVAIHLPASAQSDDEKAWLKKHVG
jgi:hypothetical protein